MAEQLAYILMHLAVLLNVVRNWKRAKNIVYDILIHPQNPLNQSNPSFNNAESTYVIRVIFWFCKYLVL